MITIFASCNVALHRRARGGGGPRDSLVSTNFVILHEVKSGQYEGNGGKAQVPRDSRRLVPPSLASRGVGQARVALISVLEHAAGWWGEDI
jgi:hypothetical protein